MYSCAFWCEFIDLVGFFRCYCFTSVTFFIIRSKGTGGPSIGEHRHCCITFEIIKDLYGKKPIVSVTYENERISIKNSLPYIKCVLRLSCVVHGPIYGRFMGCTVNGFLSI